MIEFNFSKEYTTTPYARNKEHNPKHNGEDFREKLLEWINNEQEVLIKVDDLEFPFSDSFVDASFCSLMRQDRAKFDKYIKINNKTEDERDLLLTIEEVLGRK